MDRTHMAITFMEDGDAPHDLSNRSRGQLPGPGRAFHALFSCTANSTDLLRHAGKPASNNNINGVA